MKKCSLCGTDIETGAATFFTWGDHTMIAVICGDDWCDDSLHRWASEQAIVLAPATPDELAAGKLWRRSEVDDEDAEPLLSDTTIERMDRSLPIIRHEEVTEWSDQCNSLARLCLELAVKTEDSVIAYDLETLSARLEKLRARMEAAKRGESPSSSHP